MKKFKFIDDSGFVIFIKAESQEKANEKFDKYFKTKKVVNS